MTKEECEKAIDDLLKSLGGSYARPSCPFKEDGLVFSLDGFSIIVPNISLLIPEDRKKFVDDLQSMYAKD